MVWEWWLFGAAAAAVLLGCLVPNRWLPPLPNDKLMHFAAFAVLTLLAARLAPGRLALMWWSVGLLLAGWLIEWLQQWLPDRSFCWRDIAANAAGIACAAVLSQLM